MRSFLVALLVLPACASQRQEPLVPLQRLPPPMTRLVLSPDEPPPADDVPESKRLAWLEANRPKPSVVTPVHHDEREVVIRERPIRIYEPAYERCDGWWAPLSVGIGFFGGFHRHHGWGWSVGWGRGWNCWW